MAQAGANIQAFLKLDATGFIEGVTASKEAVAQLKESMKTVKVSEFSKSSDALNKFAQSMKEIGLNSGAITTGLRNISDALVLLIPQLSQFTTLAKESTAFQKFALGLQNVATAAQRLGTDIERGSIGMNALTEVMNIWRAGVDSAEIKVTGLATAMRELVSSSTGTSSNLASQDTTVKNLRNSYGESLNTLRQFATALKQEENASMSARESIKLQIAELNQFALTGVQAYHSLSTLINEMRVASNTSKEYSTSMNQVNTTTQRWVSLTQNTVNSTNNLNTSIRNAVNTTTQFRNTISSTSGLLNTIASPIKNASGEFARLKAEMGAVSESYRVLKFDVEGNNVTLEKSSQLLRQNTLEMEKNAQAKLRALGYTGQITTAEQREANATNQATSSKMRYTSATNSATNSIRTQTSAVNGLSKAMSSLKMIGSLVASMMVWNFASSLINATRETVNAKSEMEGYFQMLHFSQSQIGDFNKALDDTVSRFQRINKYSLGETISSIGVEFNLTTEEMKKAMPIVSMITSEYLRAGRNANEASLAVKDILQGEFQRLSRETGVKGDQLKEAGWSGDKTDVMGLLEALDKVGKSRNWDVFVSKANSLNDAVLILQNRFGEWSADMVNAVQPAILNVFNSIMNFAEGLSQAIGNLWQWFTGGSWGAVVTQIGLLSGVILTASQALVMYRTGMGLAEASQLGLTKSIASVVLGLKGQEIAEVGVRNAIMSKILGVKAETIAEYGVTSAIREKLGVSKLDTVEKKLNTIATGENTTATRLLALQDKISTLEKAKLITTEEADTLRKELNTVATEMNTVATEGNIVASGGLTGALIALGGAENVTAVATGELSVAMGVLNGLFYASPIGWFALAVLGLASAFYVLTGGLSDSWDKMKTFNETVQQGDEALKPYHDRLTSLKTQLDEAKAKYGENSDEVKNLQGKVDDAQKSFDSFRESLQKATKVSGELKDELAQLEPRMDAITRKNYGSFGHTNEEADELTRRISSLGYGTDQYYTALQKLVAMEGNFEDAQKKAIPTMTDHGRGALENAENIGKWNKAYAEYIKQSTNANIAEDWWSWSWASLYAGMSKNQADTILATEQIETGVRDAFKTLQDAFSDPEGLSFFKGDIDKQIGDFFGGLGDSYNTWADGFSKWAKDGIKKAQEDLVNAFNNFFSFEWIPDPVTEFSNWIANAHMDTSWLDDWINKTFVEPFNGLGDRLMECIENIATYDYIGAFLSYWNLTDFNILDLFFGQTVSASDGSSDHPPVLDEINQVLVQPIVDFANNLVSDPLGTLGVEPIDFIAIVFPQLFGLYEGATGIATWVDTNIIQPLKDGISQGIASIPILSDIAQMLGLIPQENPNAQDKGSQLARAFGNAVETIVGNIPILGDVLRFLGVIPQANPTASSHGQNLGNSIKTAFKNAVNGMANIINDEINHILNFIRDGIDKAKKGASDLGNAIVNGVKNAIDPGSPGIIAREIIGNEFHQWIPQTIANGSQLAYDTAYQYGQMMYDGMNAVNSDFSLGGVADEYQTDAQTIATYSQMMGTDTTMAFNDMTLAVNGATTQMSTNVASTYSQIQTRQATMLNSMKSSNLTAYQQMNTQSNQSLLQMRDSTSNVTNQMVNAWAGMKDSIVATANSLRSETTAHFNTLSSNIGSFYRKIQNPSSWGSAGSPNITKAPTVRRGSTFAGGTNSRYSPYSRSGATMSLNRLKQMICPSGDCSLFDGYDLSQVVNVADFLSTFQGDIGFGWNGWNSRHYQYIRSRSNEWSMKSPVLNVKGGIPTNANFKVGEFETGQPKISFGAFQSMAESLFSAVPYAFYYNSDKYGSWQNALANGECNCWDGANALIAFARTCGFDGSIAHGSWDGIPHVWAVINGRKMDTTGWQQRGTWTPSASAGSPPNGFGNNYNGNVTVNINLYGDDVEVDENAVDLSTAKTIIDLVGINPSTGV